MGGGRRKPPQNHCYTSSVGGSGMLESAKRWLDLGCSLVPLQPNSKHIIAGFGSYGDQVTDLAGARFWFGERSCNLGLVCGAGVVVLDFDDVAGYEQWRVEVGDLAQSYTERTRRGYHVFFSGSGGSGRVGGIEVLGAGRVVALAPSTVRGFEYRPVAECGDVLLELPGQFSLLSASRGVVTDGTTDEEKSGGDADTVTRIKAAYDILAMARNAGAIGLHSRDGRWFHAFCPFHSDVQKRSFWVDIKRGLWGCYSCDVRGDLINLYSRWRGLGVTDAINELAKEL